MTLALAAPAVLASSPAVASSSMADWHLDGYYPSTTEGYNACHRDGVRWGRGYKCPWFPSSWENGQPHYELWLLY